MNKPNVFLRNVLRSDEIKIILFTPNDKLDVQRSQYGAFRSKNIAPAVKHDIDDGSIMRWACFVDCGFSGES